MIWSSVRLWNRPSSSPRNTSAAICPTRPGCPARLAASASRSTRAHATAASSAGSPEPVTMTVPSSASTAMTARARTARV